MNVKTVNYKWTQRLALLTPLLVIFVMVMMGAGHGTYVPGMILFPAAFINLIWERDFSAFFFSIGWAQYIFYGFIIDILSGNVYKNLIVVLLMTIHGVGAGVIIGYYIAYH